MNLNEREGEDEERIELLRSYHSRQGERSRRLKSLRVAAWSNCRAARHHARRVEERERARATGGVFDGLVLTRLCPLYYVRTTTTD